MSSPPLRLSLAITSLVYLLSLPGCTNPTTANRPSSTPPAEVLPDERPRGRIVTVNLPLRYVVMDFELSTPPEIGQRMDVFREGLKIGEVQLSGPIMGSAAAGDIVTGQAAVGDTVLSP
ncbi:MAG: hypothetical protein RI897_2310 [Verrucomicrobiota bacterium]|jgi:hypothetical protein